MQKLFLCCAFSVAMIHVGIAYSMELDQAPELQQLFESPLVSFSVGVTEYSNVVVYHPDNTSIATGANDGVVRIRDCAGRIIRELNGHSHAIISLVYSGNGKYLASIALDNKVLVWDLATHKIMCSIQNSQFARAVFFSKDHKAVIAVFFEGAFIYDISTGSLIKKLSPGMSFYGVNAADISPDGKYIALGSNHALRGDGKIDIWDINSASIRKSLKAHTEPICGLAFSSDGTHVISGSQDKTIKIWYFESDEVKDEVTPHMFGISTVAYCPDGRSFITGSADKTAYIWDGATRKASYLLKGCDAGIYSISYSSDGAILFVASLDGITRKWFNPHYFVHWLTEEATDNERALVNVLLKKTKDGLSLVQKNILMGIANSSIRDFLLEKFDSKHTQLAVDDLAHTLTDLHVPDHAELDQLLTELFCTPHEVPKMESQLRLGTICKNLLAGHRPLNERALCSKYIPHIISRLIPTHDTSSVGAEFTVGYWNPKKDCFAAAVGNDITIIDGDTREIKQTLNHDGKVTALVWDKFHERILLSASNEICTWRYDDKDASYKRISRIPLESGVSVTHIVLSDQTLQFAIKVNYNCIRIYDILGEFLGEFKQEEYIHSFHFTPVGCLLVASSEKCILWDIGNKRIYKEYVGASRNILLANPYNFTEYQIVAIGDTNITIIDAKHRMTTIQQSKEITTAAIDGNQLVVGTMDGSLCIWNLKDGRLVLEVPHAHTLPIVSLSLYPGIIVSNSFDSAVKAWDEESGELIFELTNFSPLKAFVDERGMLRFESIAERTMQNHVARYATIQSFLLPPWFFTWCKSHMSCAELVLLLMVLHDKGLSLKDIAQKYNLPYQWINALFDSSPTGTFFLRKILNIKQETSLTIVV